MMNSNPTSRIVIGVGLLALFGVGVSVFAIRAKQEIQVARNTPAPVVADQSTTDATAPAQSAVAATPADQAVAATSAASAASPTVGPTPIARNSPIGSDAVNDTGGAPAADVSKPSKSKASDRADRRTAKTRPSADMTATRVASAADFGGVDRSAASSSASNVEAAQAPSSTDATSTPAGATADMQQPAQTGQETAMSAAPAAGANASGASDTQITADVKSEISTAAPNSNVDVTTSKGVVALAGSVPSLDAVNQARQAAQRVAGVKYVDASALMVSNQ
jgi:hyperosmotically inducible protein